MKRRGPALFELINGGGVGRRPAPIVTLRPPQAVAPAQADTPVRATDTQPQAEPIAGRDFERHDEPVDASDCAEELPAQPAAPRFRVVERPARVTPPGPVEDEPVGPAAAAPRDEPGRLNISPSVLLLAGAGVIAVCVLIWSVAYDVGKGEAEEAARRQLRLQADGTVRDPLNADLPLNTNLVRPETRPSAPSAAPDGSGGAGTPNQSGQAAASATGDPREVGKNYLQLVTTDKTEADALVKFLGENGVSAFQVSLDGPGTGANNRARFTVFCSRGISREELKDRVPARTELDDAVGRLGRVWKGERRGSTDFSGRIWSKFTR